LALSFLAFALALIIKGFLTKPTRKFKFTIRNIKIHIEHNNNKKSKKKTNWEDISSNLTYTLWMNGNEWFWDDSKERRRLELKLLE
jgi:hypothetical protein